MAPDRAPPTSTTTCIVTTGAGAPFKGDFTIPPGPPPPPEPPDDRWAGTEPTWLDITCDVHDIELDSGRDRTISRWQVGTASITVDNSSGVYDVNVAPTSPAVLSVRPGRQIRVGMWIDTPGSGGIVQTSFHLLGRWWIDAANPTYDPTLHDIIELSCVDAKGQAGKVDIGKVDDPGMGAAETVDARIHRVLDAAAWQSAYRDVTPSAITVQATTLGAKAVDLIDLAADSAGGAVFGDEFGRVAFRSRDWQTYEPDVPVDATIGNLAATGADVVYGASDVVYGASDVIWQATSEGVCPSGWEMSFEAADMATRVLAGRPNEPPHVFDDVTAQVLYGLETFTRTDLICNNPADLDIIGARYLRVLSADFMPNVAAVTIDAATSVEARDLAATVDPTVPSRYRGVLREGTRTVFDRQFFATGVSHRIDPDTWTVRISLDDAGPFATVGNRWDDAAWGTGLWAAPVAKPAPELVGAAHG